MVEVNHEIAKGFVRPIAKSPGALPGQLSMASMGMPVSGTERGLAKPGMLQKIRDFETKAGCSGWVVGSRADGSLLLAEKGGVGSKADKWRVINWKGYEGKRPITKEKQRDRIVDRWRRVE